MSFHHACTRTRRSANWTKKDSHALGLTMGQQSALERAKGKKTSPTEGYARGYVVDVNVKLYFE
jgi:hypothetical protein